MKEMKQAGQGTPFSNPTQVHCWSQAGVASHLFCPCSPISSKDTKKDAADCESSK